MKAIPRPLITTDLFDHKQDTMTSLQQLQQMQQFGMNGNAGGMNDPAIPITGHTSRFMTYSHYYYNPIWAQGTLGQSRSIVNGGSGIALGYSDVGGGPRR